MWSRSLDRAIALERGVVAHRREALFHVREGLLDELAAALADHGVFLVVQVGQVRAGQPGRGRGRGA